jgi:hypothetical protein
MDTEPTPIPFDRLAAPARRALDGAGYATLQQLAETSESEVPDLHGMGANAVRTLGEILAEHGLSFRDDG